MTEKSTALEIALAYHEAWAGQDLDRAMSYIADDVVCEAPPGRIEGAEAYRKFLVPYLEMLESVSLIAAFGDEDKALVMYDSVTVLVPSAPGAECVTVRAGKIAHSHFLFDRLPFQAARASSSST